MLNNAEMVGEHCHGISWESVQCIEIAEKVGSVMCRTAR